MKTDMSRSEGDDVDRWLQKLLAPATEMPTLEDAAQRLSSQDQHSVNRFLVILQRLGWWPRGNSKVDREIAEKLQAANQDSVWLYTPCHDVTGEPAEERCHRFFAEFFLHMQADDSESGEFDWKLCKTFGWSKWDLRSEWLIRDQPGLD